MITRLIYLTVSLGVASAAWAGDKTPELKTPEFKTSELKTAGYHLKRQSTFEVAPDARAPFWPIGWAPSSKNTTQSDAPAPVFTITPDQFSVTSILLGPESFAIINDRTYKQGEYLRPSRAAKAAPGGAAHPAAPLPPNVRVWVARIMDGQVILQAGTQAIAVPLRRPHLSEKKGGDEDLLSLSDR
jgi:hypothetical protein